MKIAIVFHGLSGGNNFKNGGQKVPGKECFENLQNNLINPARREGHDIDIYYHTWASEDQEEILKLYNPKDYMVEETKSLAKYSFLERLKIYLLNKYLKRNERERKNNIHSKWYSLKRSLELIDRTKSKYDLAISLRFDMVFKREIHLNEFDPDKINFGVWTALSIDGKTILPDEVISKHDISNLKNIERGYPKKSEGFHDFFIATNPSLLIKTFLPVYDNLNTIMKKSGLSNHNIILEVLKRSELLEQVKFCLRYIYDYTLYRWL